MENNDTLEDLIKLQRQYATDAQIHLDKAMSIKEEFRDNIMSVTLLNQKFELDIKMTNNALNKSLDIVSLIKQKGYDLKLVAEMKCRLFYNLGLTKELNENKHNYFARSLDISTSYNLNDETFRCYMGRSRYLQKQGKLDEALAECKRAFKILYTCEDLESSTISFKVLYSMINLELYEFKMAISILYEINRKKEYKREINIIKKLRSFSQRLKNTDSDLEIHEEMGDLFCKLRLYKSAISSYKKMYSKAVISRRRRLEALVSLSRTCYDDYDYAGAIKYSRLELENLTSLSEKFATFVNMSAMHELHRLSTPSDVIDTLKKALSCGEQLNNVQFQARNLISRFQNLREDYDLFCVKENLNLEKIKSICLVEKEDASDESDVSDHEFSLPESDDDEEFDRKTNSHIVIKRNDKGETKLHLAVIRGDMEETKRLLSKGHPIRIEDHCGWTALHEACNHGHVDIADFLISKGANVNCRASGQGQGITPLIDACGNGHITIIRLLFANKANKFIKDDAGRRAYSHLHEYIESGQADECDMPILLELANELKLPGEILRTIQEEMPRDLKVITDSTPISTLCGEDEFKQKAVPAYVGAISEVGSSATRRLHYRTTKLTRSDHSALMPVDAIAAADDDWLIDDLSRSATTKRRRPRKEFSDDLIKTSGATRNTFAKKTRIDKNKVTRTKSSETSISSSSNAESSRGHTTPDIHVPSTSFATSPTAVVTKPKEVDLAAGDAIGIENVHIIDLEGKPTEDIKKSNTNVEEAATVEMKVFARVNSETYMIPVSKRINEKRDVRWLNGEIGIRHQMNVGSKPLILRTTLKCGAILSVNDDIFILKENGKLEVIAETGGIIEEDLQEKYVKACTYLSTTNYKNIGLKLSVAETTGNLTVDSFNLRTDRLVPIVRSLNGITFITELCFTNCQITDDSLERIFNNSKFSSNLRKVDISHNKITYLGLEKLRALRDDSDGENRFKSLMSLNLSHNKLTYVETLQNFIKLCVNLETLVIENTDIDLESITDIKTKKLIKDNCDSSTD